MTDKRAQNQYRALKIPFNCTIDVYLIFTIARTFLMFIRSPPLQSCSFVYPDVAVNMTMNRNKVRTSVFVVDLMDIHKMTTKNILYKYGKTFK